MREVVLLSLLSAGSSLAANTDRNVFYIKPSRGSSLPSALVHNNYDGNQVVALLCNPLTILPLTVERHGVPAGGAELAHPGDS